MRKTTLALCGILVLSTIGAARVAMTQENRKTADDILQSNQKPAVKQEGAHLSSDDDSKFPRRNNSKPPLTDAANVFGEAPGYSSGDAGGLGMSGGGGYPGAAGMAGGAGYPGMSGAPATNPGAYRQRQIIRTVVESYMEPIPEEELAKAKELQDAIQSLKTSNNEVARKKATEFIQQQLASQFEVDLKQREKELTEVEQRVTKLREQLDKRKAAQKAIIDLRLQTIVNDADGLGFPDMNVGGTNLSVPPSNAPLYDPNAAARIFPTQESPLDTFPTTNRTDQ